MRALHIVHVVPYYEAAWAYGGIPRSVTSLARAQARRGHDVTVCTTDACDADSRVAGGRHASGRGADGVNVRIFPNLSNRLAYHLQLFIPLGLAGYLTRHARDIDVVHVHGCHHLPGAIAARLLRRAGVPYVLAPHGTAPRIERRRFAKRVFDFTLGRGVVAGAARVLAVSDAERRQLEHLGVPAASITVVGNPLEVAEFDAPREPGRFRQRFGLGRRPLVLFLGKLTPRKSVDVLVEAFALVHDARMVLVIAGNDMGAGRAIRRLVRRHDLEAQTIFTGLLRGQERLDALADADLVVYPSVDEVFGLVAVESLLCGTPVVVADDSGCGEVIRRTGGGRIVRHGDVHALAEALRISFNPDDDLRESVPDAAQRVRTWYGSDVVSSQIENVYRQLLVSPAASRVGAAAGVTG